MAARQILRCRQQSCAVFCSCWAHYHRVLCYRWRLSAGTYQGGEIDAVSNPTTLVMLLPVVVMLVVSTKTRNIYAGIGVGLSLVPFVGLAAGLFTFADVFANDAANNAAVGFLIDGVNNILPTCALVISVFGIMGVLNDAGLLDYLADSILQSKAASTERGAELICMLGISLTTILFGGVTSASILTFGPILNRIGSARTFIPTVVQTFWMVRQTACLLLCRL